MREHMILAIIILLATTSLGIAQERAWSLDQNDKEAYLVFGTPETDDVGVSFWCKLKSNLVHFYAPETNARLKIGNAIPFSVKISSKTFRFKGKTTANQEAGNISLEAELKITDPVFTALQNADYFSVIAGNTKNNYPLGESDVSGFLALCTAP
jgi:hypothetical protein